MFSLKKMQKARLLAVKGEILAEMQKEQQKPFLEQTPAYVRGLRDALEKVNREIAAA